MARALAIFSSAAVEQMGFSGADAARVKTHILERNESETIVTDNLTGVRCRVIRNKFSETLV